MNKSWAGELRRDDEGRRVAHEYQRRASVFADSTSPIGKQYLGRRYYRLALQA